MRDQLLRVGAAIMAADEVSTGRTWFLLRDGRIVQVGQGAYEGNLAELEIIDRPHGLAMPGLVNTHGHAAMTLLRGAGDDLPLMRWLTERVFPLESGLTKDAVYWGTMLACWEMIRSGTTCYTDMYMFMDDAASAVVESGMRGLLSLGMDDMDAQRGRQRLEEARLFSKTWNGAANGRIRVALGPHAPYTCSAAYLARIAEAAAELAVPVQIHLSETRAEVEESLRQHNCSPIQHVARNGLFEQPVLAAHCVHVNAADIDLLREHRVCVAHNPQSNLKLASGVAPLGQLLAAGVTVGLGTDGCASNNNLDMFEEMRLAALLHKGVTGDAETVPTATAFRMATEDGATAVFLEPGHGRLCAGAVADIVILDLHSPHFVPGHCLLSNVVYAAGADDVLDVFVDGRLLLSNREVTTLDTERIRHEAQRLGAVLAQSPRRVE